MGHIDLSVNKVNNAGITELLIQKDKVHQQHPALSSSRLADTLDLGEGFRVGHEAFCQFCRWKPESFLHQWKISRQLFC